MSLIVKKTGPSMKTSKKEEVPQPPKFCEAVAIAVKNAIGKSPDFFRIRANFLYIKESNEYPTLDQHRYRVNVQRTFPGDQGMPDKVKITDSYFITTDGEGKILHSSPELVKKYG
jgi:hypothetical protein